jgi:hypothetical protein
MTPINEVDLDQRVARLERAVASVQASLDLLHKAANESAHADTAGHTDSTAPAARQGFTRNAGANAGDQQQRPPATGSARRADTTPRPASGFAPPRWLADRSAEWWLSALGVVFLIVALFLLYKYAVDHNWITPLVRVFTGVLVGAGLVAAGARFTTPKLDAPDVTVGLREILLGGGIAAWYITSYAAAVFYQLISIPVARFLFLALSVAAGALALKERRILFAVTAVLVGFAAPMILPVSHALPSVTALSLYLAALGALGVVLYLMRGWQSVLWITFVGFWVDLDIAFSGFGVRPVGYSAAVIVASLTAILGGAVFTRAPILRRRLLAIGSDRYVPSTASDRPALWIVTLTSLPASISALTRCWPDVPSELWASAAIVFGIVAFWLSRRPDESDQEIPHVEMSGFALWTLGGSLALVATLANRLGLNNSVEPLVYAVAALHAGLVMYLVRERRFVVPRAIAKVTLLVALFASASYDVGPTLPTGGLWSWNIAQVIVLAVAIWFWQLLRREPGEELQGTASAIGAYAVLLLLLAHMLGGLWMPLVTVSYAVAGATLLVLSRQGEGRGLLLKLGGLTMAAVVVRLLIVDLSTVETIWRVLLFLVCGILFLFTSYRLKPPRPPDKVPDAARG